MTKINVRNIYLIGGVTIMNIAVGVYERLVPSRGILYSLQTGYMSSLGEVPIGTTSVNMTNSMNMMTTNSMSSFNMMSSGLIFIGLLIVAAIVMGSFMTLGGRR
jgi:hypothetical protein